MTASWAVQSLGNESVSCEPNTGQSSVKPEGELCANCGHIEIYSKILFTSEILFRKCILD